MTGVTSSNLLGSIDLNASTISELAALYRFCRSGSRSLEQSLERNRGSNALAKLVRDFDLATIDVPKHWIADAWAN